MEPTRERLLQAAERGHRGLLRLCPRPFRDRYGDEITRAFAEMARERYRRAGLRGLAALELRAIADTLATAWREHRDHLGTTRGGGLVAAAQDLRYAVRYLARRSAFTLVVVLTLGLGIGATTAIFSVIYATLLRPLPFPGGDRLVLLEHRFADGESGEFSLREVAALRQQNRAFAAIEEVHSMSFILLGEGEAERVTTGVVSTGFFDLLGVAPLLGRTFRHADDGERVLVLSHDYWRRRMAGDPGVVGRQVEMNDDRHTVIGVLPPLPAFPEPTDVYMPTTSCPFRRGHVARGELDARMVAVVGRLAPGVTPRQAGADAAGVVRAVAAAHPRPPESTTRDVAAVPVAEELGRSARPTFLILLVTVVFVLLIVCANVANLTLARLVRRERELAVRTALGAGRGRLLRQLITESLLLSALGGVVGLVLAHEMLGRLAAFAARFTVRADEIRIDGAVLAFTLAVVLVTGVVLGALPAFPRCHDLVAALKDGSWGRFLGHGRQRLQRLLVVAQLAVSCVLLVGAGLMLRSLTRLQQVDPGFRTDNVVTMTLDLNWSRYGRADEYRAFYTRLLDALAIEPEVESAAVASTFPLNDFNPGRERLWIAGRMRDPARPEPPADVRAASVDYFTTLGIELVAGRTFGCGDDLDAPPVAIVNRSLARRYFPGGEAVGRRLSVDDGETWMEIVGVVGDVRQYGLAAAVRDEVYLPLGQYAWRVMTLLARTGGEPQRVARRMWQAVSAIDSQQAVAHLRTLDQIRRDALEPPRLTTALLGLFAFVALALSAAGVSGMLAFFVSQRTHEIGVRMALGAGRRAVLRMVLREGMVLAAAGLAIGLAGAAVMARWLSGLLYEIAPTDLRTYLGTAAVLLAVAVVACAVPARWATRVQPVDALRQD